MMNLLTILLLVGQSNSEPSIPKLPGEEYLDFSIIPTLVVTKVLYTDTQHIENISVGLNNISLSVTKTGSNPL